MMPVVADLPSHRELTGYVKKAMQLNLEGGKAGRDT